MEDAQFIERARFEALRGERGFAVLAPGLWSVGSLEAFALPCIAIVGTRAASVYGREVARRFAYELGRAGLCVLSGLALGIDTAAHEGALEADAPTAAVLGGGHAHLFPRRNRGLAERIVASGGALLSPFPPAEPPRPGQFLARNGIVAALADAVLVVEAPARSGALNTAGWAAGRIPVLAVPGDIDRPHMRGCHDLIRDGAILARHPGDVLEALGIPTPPAAEPKPLIRADPLEAAILAHLRAGETAFDTLEASLAHDLTTRAAATLPQILAALTRLLTDGLIEARDGQRYALRR